MTTGTGPRSVAQHARQRLLDNQEQNLGNREIIKPGQVTLVPGIVSRLLDLRADSPLAQVVTVSMGQVLQDPTSPVGTSCPIVGIIEFGNGGAFSYVEIDVPSPDAHTINAPPTPTGGSYRYPRSGTAITVPAGSIRVYARNDALNALTGAVAPITSGAGTDPEVYAHIAYGTPSTSVAPTRTVYMFNSANTMAAGAASVVQVPPFATGVRFHRMDAALGFAAVSPVIQVALMDNNNINMGLVYNVAAGDPGYVALSNTTYQIRVNNTSAVAITLAAVFDIGLVG
jgi:hypothetical protein